MKKYFKVNLSKIVIAIIAVAAVTVGFGASKAEAATRGVSFVIHQPTVTEGYPIESSRIVVTPGKDIAGYQPELIPYQQARAFSVNTGTTVNVSGQVCYLRWGWFKVRKSYSYQVYVPNGANSVWIR
jgi:hypothetical protein